MRFHYYYTEKNPHMIKIIIQGLIFFEHNYLLYLSFKSATFSCASPLALSNLPSA